MYLTHYQLSKEPFSFGPDPAFIWLGEKNRQVFDTLDRGVLQSEGCVVLCGDVGTGKTTLVNYLTSRDGIAAVHIALHEPGLKAFDFCNILALELRMDRRFDNRGGFYTALSLFLAKNFGAYRRLLLVVEEAQRVNREILAELGALARLTIGGRGLLKVVLVGNPRLEEVLESEGNGGARLEVAALCRLEPFSEEDTRSYIEHRLRLAGAKRQLFSPAAIRSVFSLSNGYPRLINMVCDHALLCGYGAHLEVIGEDVIKDCSRDLTVALGLDETPKLDYTVGMVGSDTAAGEGTARQAGPLSRRGLLILAAAICLAGLVIYLVL
jgi:general secretion pathway protein A